MTEPLITIAREYLQNVSTTYMSDVKIERLFNESRKYVNNLQIFPEDYNTSRFYKIGYSKLMNVVLKDSDGTVIDNTNYDIDVFNGIVAFKNTYTIPGAIYATFNYYNFYKAVAECWLYLAAIAISSGRTKLGDEELPKDYTNREFCIQKYWDFCQSENIQMGR